MSGASGWQGRLWGWSSAWGGQGLGAAGWQGPRCLEPSASCEPSCEHRCLVSPPSRNSRHNFSENKNSPCPFRAYILRRCTSRCAWKASSPFKGRLQNRVSKPGEVVVLQEDRFWGRCDPTAAVVVA